MKLKLLLSQSELTSLSGKLVWYVQGQQVENLRAYAIEYLVISVLYDLQQKISKKAEAVRLFGPDRRINGVKLTLSRNEALALYCFIESLFSPEASAAVVVRGDSFEGNLLQRLQSQVHQTYLV